MRTALVTITTGSMYEKLAEITHPTLLAYALKIGAEFIVWRDTSGHEIPAYKKLEIYKLLDAYDRVLYVDTDILIREDAPNLFELVPETHVGLFEEGKFQNRRPAMKHLAPTEMEWVTRGEYYNTGVMVVSKAHKNMFLNPLQEVNNFMEQTWLNLMLFKSDFPVFQLPHRFNRMIWLDQSGEQRFDSYFLHYAGVLSNNIDCLSQVAADLETWKKDAPEFKYPRKIHFTVRGGLGDQVCAEPVLRFVKETIYKNDRVMVHTDHPELFKNLDVELYKFGHIISEPGIFQVNLAPVVGGDINFSLMHHVDYCSLKAFGGILPKDSKVIQLPCYRKEAPLVIDSKTVLLHASKWWPTKTFPLEFWKSVAEEVVKAGLTPVFIGKTSEDGPSVHTIEGYDSLVDQTSLVEMIGAIQSCGYLITTDSAPLHIANSSDCKLGLVSPIRAPWTLLGERPFFALPAEVLCNGEPWRQADFSPNSIASVSLDDPKFVKGVHDSLPTMEQIRAFLKR